MAVKTVLRTQEINGTEPIEELPAEILLYGYRINRPGPLEITLDLDHEKAIRANIEPGVHEAVIVRNKMQVWVGPINTMDEIDSDQQRLLSFRGEDGFAHTKKMFLTSTLTYNDADQFTIAKGLVDHHQNKAGGNFGIDVSSIGTSGVLRDRTYYDFEHKNVYDALTELAEVENGFDITFDSSTRRLVAHYERAGQRNTNLVWDSRTIRSFSRSIDASTQASQVLGIGAGEGDEMLRRNFQDSTAVARYGLTQKVYTNKDVKIQATLDGHIQRQLEMFSEAPETIAIVVGVTDPPLFSYVLGDEGRVVWKSPYDPVNEYRRLLGFDVVWNKGEEQVVLYLDTL